MKLYKLIHHSSKTIWETLAENKTDAIQKIKEDVRNAYPSAENDPFRTDQMITRDTIIASINEEMLVEVVKVNISSAAIIISPHRNICASMAQRRLKVRTGRSYSVGYLIDLGQRNASIFKRPLTPLSRYFPATDAVCVVEPGYDLIHTFNAVPLFSRTPYVVSFEDFFPRVPEDRYIGWLHRFLAQQAAGSRCVALLAASQFAYRQFELQNRNYPWSNILLQKTRVLLPAIHVRASQPKRPAPRLRLLFVGVDFMRKGLQALLLAHAALRGEGLPVSTTVVSSLRWSPDDYIGPTDPAIVEETRRLLEQEAVEVFGVNTPLPNLEVLSLMRRADYLVLPTFHDTFGYVSIEAMSVATPVIATATCALPEVVVDGMNGHLLPFDNDSTVGKWQWVYRKHDPDYNEAYRQQIKRLAQELTLVLRHCWETRADYEAKSSAALIKMKSSFNPALASHELETLYAGVVA